MPNLQPHCGHGEQEAFHSICLRMSGTTRGIARRTIAEPIACKEVSVFEAYAFPCTPIVTFYKLLHVVSSVLLNRTNLAVFAI